MKITIPATGWATNRDGNLTYTVHGPSFLITPPEHDGWYCRFIARHGIDYTTWTYRPIEAS